MLSYVFADEGTPIYPLSGAGDLHNELALAERTLRQEYPQLRFHNDIQRHPTSAVHDFFLWIWVAAFHDVDLRASGRSILLRSITVWGRMWQLLTWAPVLTSTLPWTGYYRWQRASARPPGQHCREAVAQWTENSGRPLRGSEHIGGILSGKAYDQSLP